MGRKGIKEKAFLVEKTIDNRWEKQYNITA